ncbi:hypothetical protein [Maridesulfovibrio sp.]|uniref:hypothetical protein n=1 Tax=Maridesulfovibrio sp. TaxID=2795000 RepID=UPI0029CA2D1A|nr:hypothetical protein [Maridesulfovibrio sp.]
MFFDSKRVCIAVAITFAAVFVLMAKAVYADDSTFTYRVTLPGNATDNFHDYTNLTIWQSGKDGKGMNGTQQFFGGNQGPSDNATVLQSTGTYIFQLESGTMQQFFNCTVKTHNNTWSFDSKCNPPYSSSGCMGCQYIQAPSGNKYFHILPITHVNPGVQSYWQAYLLDQKNGNLLFRGPNPTLVKNGKEEFDFKGLLNVLKQRYKTQFPSGSFPGKFMFVDISLINSDTSAPPSTGNPSNGYVLNAEYRFFDSTVKSTTAIPSPDKYVNGTVSLPDGTSIDGALLWWNIKPEASSGPRLGTLVSKIGDMMESTGGTPYLIYIHCISGCDRTGDVAVSYLLHERRMKPEDAYNYGTTVFDVQGNQHRLTPHSTWLPGLEKYCEGCYSECSFTTPDSFPPQNYYPWNKTSWGGKKCDDFN